MCVSEVAGEWMSGDEREGGRGNGRGEDGGTELGRRKGVEEHR